jgi:hypothetical protein
VKQSLPRAGARRSPVQFPDSAAYTAAPR